MATYFLALTSLQVTELLRELRIRRDWFGVGTRGMLPLKIRSHDAIVAHVQALRQKPAAVISVTLSFSYFHELIENGSMVPCLHVGGYRLYADLQCDGMSFTSCDVMEVL